MTERFGSVWMDKAISERTQRMLDKYGVSREAWDEELGRLHFHCPGCQKPFSSTRLPCIDHDHLTGQWRGILCTACNMEVGVRHDDADWFERMADYLHNPPCEHYEMFVPGSIGEDRARRE